MPAALGPTKFTGAIIVDVICGQFDNYCIRTQIFYIHGNSWRRAAGPLIRRSETEEPLAAFEPNSQVIGDVVDRDPRLRHGIAFAHCDGVVL